MMSEQIDYSEPVDYSEPGPFSTFDPAQVALATGLPDDPVGLCLIAQGLVIQPNDATALPEPVAPQRLAEKNLHRVSDIVAALLALDPSPLHVPRPAPLRVVGTCRHFALLSTALLRLRGVPARARCGFGTYFVAGKGLDHWVTEYWRPDQQRWVRIDAEILGRSFVPEPRDLAPGEFLTGGEAWTLHRAGAIDADQFGVPGTDHAWGPAEIRGNAVRDLASLMKIETLPWDEWGRMQESYQGRTGPEYDALMDRVASACAGNDLAAIDRLYTSEDLAVPAAWLT